MADFNAQDMQADEAENCFSKNWPVFYELVKDFSDFTLAAGLSASQLQKKEEELEFRFDSGLKKLFLAASALAMNGLSIRADQLGVINLPESEALILGYLNLGSAADRILMLPNDESIYYLEQHNGAITKIAKNIDALFNEILPRRLYG